MAETKEPATELAKQPETNNLPVLPNYDNANNFALLQRMATSLAASDIVPDTYKNKPANCMIALEMANRMNIAAMMVMQNMYIVKGKPSWAGAFVIARINSSGRFAQALEFVFEGEGETRSCYAWTKSYSGAIITGTKITYKMAKDEGWLSNSKWKNMPDQMFSYRAGAFFGRVHCPDLIMGMQTAEEVEDTRGRGEVEPVTLTPEQMKIVKDEIKAGKPEEAQKVIDEIPITQEQRDEIEAEMSLFYPPHPKDGKQ